MSGYVELKDGGLLVVKDLGADVMKVDAASGVITATVSDESEDSDGDIIHQGKTKQGRGWVLDRFNAAPVITWMHDMYSPSLSAPETRAKVTKDAERGRVLVLDPAVFDVADPAAELVDGKLRRGAVKEWSVGFRGDIAEKRRNDDGSLARGYDFYEQRLIEVAVVNRGANYSTSTAIKSLLAAPGMAAAAEAGADAEAAELKSEIEQLTNRIAQLERTIIDKLGIDDSGQEDEDVLNDLAEYDTQRRAALSAVYDRLVATGTAHA